MHGPSECVDFWRLFFESKKIKNYVLGFSNLNCIIYRRPSKRYQKVSRRMEEKEARRLVESYTDMIMRIGTNYLKSTTDAEDMQDGYCDFVKREKDNVLFSCCTISCL